MSLSCVCGGGRASPPLVVPTFAQAFPQFALVLLGHVHLHSAAPVLEKEALLQAVEVVVLHVVITS